MKLLAVRSGLARYGRNNISYGDGMGSMHRLNAYYTDYQFEEDNWNEIRMMDRCESCKICVNNCLNKAIPDPSNKNFVVDVGKCVTLYNEIEGEFPDWMRSETHNALFGCLKCQLPCPENKNVLELAGKFEDVTEEETKKIVEETPDEEVLESLYKKLRIAGDIKSLKAIFPIVSRNLRVLLNV